ncbi:MAG: hypothetical protein APF77_22010 [Clostridia bacterium BRH_c25]|nr:MAG: hypothetical protein APF77_22010 [Clostridia bacterium BRH_c25]
MLTLERLSSLEKDELEDISKTLRVDDIHQLVDWLSEKDDTTRYHSFLLLQHRSEYSDDVYLYWDIFCEKLKSENSYQRSIELMLIAANAKWDMENKLDNVIDEYLSLLNDEKPITVRQCIQSLSEIVPYKKHLLMKISDQLISFNMGEIRATMQKLILIDILTVLTLIRKQQPNNEIESYILNALSGGVLDKKAVKRIEAML